MTVVAQTDKVPPEDTLYLLYLSPNESDVFEDLAKDLPQPTHHLYFALTCK